MSHEGSDESEYEKVEAAFTAIATQYAHSENAESLEPKFFISTDNVLDNFTP
jgi:hypothetical protein